MSTADTYEINRDSTRGLWATVVCTDETMFHGVVEDEKPYGVYILIDGDPDRLNFFPWTSVRRVVIKN